MVFKNKFDPSHDAQPIAIRELFDLPDTDSDRLYNDQKKIKIPSQYKKGHCLFNIIKCWNDSKLKQAGNLFSLKKLIKLEFTKSPPCPIKNCNICLLDAKKDYKKYMSK